MAIAKYGLIGYPLTHSFSPQYFERKFAQSDINAIYKLFPLKEISLIGQVLHQESDLLGFNVTIPHKESIIPFLDDIDETATKIGAVNCVRIRDNKLIGYNTDVLGFETSLTPLLQSQHTKALILGTGGASKAVSYVLKKLDIEHTFISRNGKANTMLITDISKETIETHNIIINTTPVGMHPNINEKPLLPYQYINSSHLLYDLIYNPAMTAFLSEGVLQGAAIKNGLEMLELQAEASWAIWNN